MKSLFGILMLISAVLMMTFSISAAEEVIKLKISTHITPDYKDMFPPAQQFADRINELGKGRVEAKLYHSESLVKAKDIVPALMNGWSEIVFHATPYITDVWPEIGGIALPFLYKDESDCRNRWMAGTPLFELVNKEMDRKYGARMLASGIMKRMIIATRQKVIEKPDDLKGLKIRSVSKIDVEYLKACGAVPLALSSSEVNEALRRESLDGLFISPGTATARNLDDMLSYALDTKPVLSVWGFQIYILNKTFDSWHKEVREAILQAAKEYDERVFEAASEHYDKEVLPRLRKKTKFISPDAENMKKFMEIAQGTYQDWAALVDKEFAKKFIELSQTP